MIYGRSKYELTILIRIRLINTAIINAITYANAIASSIIINAVIAAYLILITTDVILIAIGFLLATHVATTNAKLINGSTLIILTNSLLKLVDDVVVKTSNVKLKQ